MSYSPKVIWHAIISFWYSVVFCSYILFPISVVIVHITDDWIFNCSTMSSDPLCGLVARVPGYRPRGLGFDSRRYQIFWEEVGLEQGPLKPCEYNWGATWMEKWRLRDQLTKINSHGDPLCWPCNTLYPQKLALTSRQAAVARSVVRLQTKAMEFSFFYSLQSVYDLIVYILQFSPALSTRNKIIYFLFPPNDLVKNTWRFYVIYSILLTICVWYLHQLMQYANTTADFL
jgi:hypothetical protein